MLRRATIAAITLCLGLLVCACAPQRAATRSDSASSSVAASSGIVPESWTSSATAPRPAPKPKVVKPVVGGYIGSALSNKYHRPTCPKGSKIRAKNLVYFPTVAAAKKAGYQPCHICRPPKK